MSRIHDIQRLLNQDHLTGPKYIYWVRQQGKLLSKRKTETIKQLLAVDRSQMSKTEYKEFLQQLETPAVDNELIACRLFNGDSVADISESTGVSKFTIKDIKHKIGM